MFSQARTLVWGIGLLAMAAGLVLAMGASGAVGGEPAVQRIVSMQYPALARMARLQGGVKLRIRISPDGTANQIDVVSGPEPLATPARQNIAKWRFSSCTSTATVCTIEIDFSFVLDGTCSDLPRCPTDFQVDLPNKVVVRSQVYDKILPDAAVDRK